MIAKAKEDDMLKREKLKDLYSKAGACLQKLDDEAISILDSQYPGRGVLTSLKEKTNLLRKEDYNLLIAGDLRKNTACTQSLRKIT